MSTSTHKAEVVPVVLEPHPNADTLSLVSVWGYKCAVKTADWQGITRAAYIVPDSLVDVRRPEFSFLAEQANADGKARIKAKKLRGIVSYGLLVPVEAELGADLAESLGVERYEPPEAGAPRSKADRFVVGGEECAGPALLTGPEKYDVDAFERYAHIMFTPGEPVSLSEKLDGSNARYVFWDNQFHVKTRTRWIRRQPNYDHVTVEGLVAKGLDAAKAQEIYDRVHGRAGKLPLFWEVLERTPALMKFLQDNPGTTVYGEVFGHVNRIKYGLPDLNRFAAFDLYRDGRFLDASEVTGSLPSLVVPQLGVFPYDFDHIKELSQGKTLVPDAKAGTIREGVVVRPISERWDDRLGRVILKAVSPVFLEKF